MAQPYRWQLQDAKNKFSRVAEEAVTYGPQIVTKHGKDAVVVISKEEYERLSRPASSFVAFLQESPLVGSSLVIQRDDDEGRDIDLS